MKARRFKPFGETGVLRSERFVSRAAMTCGMGDAGGRARSDMRTKTAIILESDRAVATPASKEGDVLASRPSSESIIGEFGWDCAHTTGEAAGGSGGGGGDISKAE